MLNMVLEAEPKHNTQEIQRAKSGKVVLRNAPEISGISVKMVGSVCGTLILMTNARIVNVIVR